MVLDQNLTMRASNYVGADNCSIVQIVDGEVTVFGHRIYLTEDNEIDYSQNSVTFYEFDGGTYSLNQAPESATSCKTIKVGLNIAFDIFQAFKEIIKINERKLFRSLS